MSTQDLLDELAAIEKLEAELRAQTHTPPASPTGSLSSFPSRVSPTASQNVRHSSSSASSYSVASSVVDPGSVTYRSPMYRSVSPSRAHLPAGRGGVVYTSLSRAPRFKDSHQEVPGPGHYRPHATDFSPVAVPRDASIPPALQGAHTKSAVLAPTTLKGVRIPVGSSPVRAGSVGRGVYREVQRPVQRGDGNQVEALNHEKAMASTALAGGASGGAVGGAPAFTLEEAARDLLSAAGGDALEALGACVKREAGFRRELGSVRDAAHAARIAAQGALSSALTDLGRERGVVSGLEGDLSVCRERLRGWEGAMRGALRDAEGTLVQGLMEAAAPDSYGRTHPGVLKALETCRGFTEGLRDAIERLSLRQHHQQQQHQHQHQQQQNYYPHSQQQQQQQLEVGESAQQQQRDTSPSRTRPLTAPIPTFMPHQPFKGFKSLEPSDLGVLGKVESGVAKAPTATTPARNRPLTGAISTFAKTSASGAAISSFVKSRTMSSASSASSSPSPQPAAATPFKEGSGAASSSTPRPMGATAAAAASTPSTAAEASSITARLRRLHAHYARSGDRTGEFFNSPALSHYHKSGRGGGWDGVSTPALVASSSTSHRDTLRLPQFINLCVEAQLLDERLTLPSLDLTFTMALEHGEGEGVDGGLAAAAERAVEAQRRAVNALARGEGGATLGKYVEMLQKFGVGLGEIKGLMVKEGVPPRSQDLFLAAFSPLDPLSAAALEVARLKGEGPGRAPGGEGEGPKTPGEKRRLATLEASIAAAKATAGLSFDQFVLAITDVACRKYPGLAEGAERSGGLLVSNKALKHCLHTALLPLLDRVEGGGGESSSGGGGGGGTFTPLPSPTGKQGVGGGRTSPVGNLPHSLRCLPHLDLPSISDSFSTQFLQREVLALFEQHAHPFKGLFGRFSEVAWGGGEVEFVSFRGLENFAREFKVVPGVFGEGKGALQDLFVCAREVAGWAQPGGVGEDKELRGDIQLNYQEVLMTIGLVVFVLGQVRGGERGEEEEGGDLSARILGFVGETARGGAPWDTLQGGRELLAAAWKVGGGRGQ